MWEIVYSLSLSIVFTVYLARPLVQNIFFKSLFCVLNPSRFPLYFIFNFILISRFFSSVTTQIIEGFLPRFHIPWLNTRRQCDFFVFYITCEISLDRNNLKFWTKKNNFQLRMLESYENNEFFVVGFFPACITVHTNFNALCLHVFLEHYMESLKSTRVLYILLFCYWYLYMSLIWYEKDDESFIQLNTMRSHCTLYIKKLVFFNTPSLCSRIHHR